MYSLNQTWSFLRLVLAWSEQSLVLTWQQRVVAVSNRGAALCWLGMPTGQPLHPAPVAAAFQQFLSRRIADKSWGVSPSSAGS